MVLLCCLLFCRQQLRLRGQLQDKVFFFILYKFMTKITLGIFCLNRKKVVFRPFESREPSWLRRIFCLNLDFFYAITLPITNSHRAVFSVN